jgi:hypothetical protein
MLFEKVTKEHIIQGIKDFEAKGYPDGFGPSSTYDVAYEGKHYPPPSIMAYAYYHAEGSLLNSGFKVGKGSDCFIAFERNGIPITKKIDPVTTLISHYKKHIKKTQLENERYKWELLSDYKGRPNLNANNLSEELKSVDYSNLLYAMSKAVVKELSAEKPEEVRSLFKMLFDESIDLNIRVKKFNDESLVLYRSLGKTLQHHQDERTIATYLTFHNPDKYTFYKYSYYKKYCKLLGVKQAKKNKKYTHYLTLIDELIESHIKTDQELISQIKNYIPEYYNGENHLLLAQDILYQMLDKEVEVNYWVFQGDPKVFDFEAAIAEGSLDSFTVTAHKDKIKVGDKVIIWLAGENAGCYALAEITSEPQKVSVSRDDKHWKVSDPNDIKAGIKITHNLFSNPILWDTITDYEEFANFKGGNQGSNFSSTEEEYETIIELINNDSNSFYLEIKKNYPPAKFKDFIKILKRFISENQIDYNDKRVSFNVRKSKNRLVFIIGKRYAFMIEGKGESTFYSFISNRILSDNHGQFNDAKGKPANVYWNSVSDVRKFENEIIEGCKYELDRDHTSPFRKYRNIDFINEIYQLNLDEDYQANELDRNLSKKINKMPTNKILYGPPGTGKTFYLKEHLFDQYTIKETSISKEKYFEDTVSSLTWWQVTAIALIEMGTSRVNAILENRWVSKKASLSESKNVRATIWGTLQMHTIAESKTVAYTQRQVPLIFDKNEDKSWQLIEAELKEQAPELYETLDSVNNFKANPNTIIKHYDFVTFHQSFAYEDFIEGIKPVLPVLDGEESKDLGYTIEDGVFKNLCSKADKDPDNRYAIFIDEINRGNVSAIFGELITLIETDKRLGAKNELKIKLPYSKKEFGVPSNVDIYGTMNTADRSVEALDTALRRRFEFKEMMPNYAVVQNEDVDGIKLSKVLQKINERIELLIDRDHTIGHSYFVNVDTAEKLANAFNNKIVPLLQEYFYGDYGKIGLVLGKGFVEKKENKDISFADFKYENSEDFKTPTFVLKQVGSESIVDAVNLLFGTNETTDID